MWRLLNLSMTLLSGAMLPELSGVISSSMPSAGAPH